MTYTTSDRDSLLKNIQRATVSIAAIALTLTTGLYVGIDIGHRTTATQTVVQAPPVTVNVPAPVVLGAPVTKALATSVPKPVVKSVPKVTVPKATTKRVVTSGGS